MTEIKSRNSNVGSLEYQYKKQHINTLSSFHIRHHLLQQIRIKTSQKFSQLNSV